MFFAAISAIFGVRATIPAYAGYHVATWIVTAGIGFGFLAALERFPEIFIGLKVAGSLYVLWLAWKMFRAGTVSAVRDARPAGVLDGVLLLVLNPKAYVIIALMFTQFLDASEPGKVVLITTVFTLNNLVAFSLWALIGDQIAGSFRTAESARRLNIFFGAILAGVALWMLLS